MKYKLKCDFVFKMQRSLEKNHTMPQLADSKTTNSTCEVQLLSRNYFSTFFTNLKSLQNDERFCDVELVAGGEQTHVIKAHRIVLSSSSSYFEAMFGNDSFNENREIENRRVVKIHSIDYRILKNLIDFIYTGKIEIDQINVQELLAAADMLQLPDVVAGCENRKISFVRTSSLIKKIFQVRNSYVGNFIHPTHSGY